MNSTRSISLPEELCQAAEQKFAQRFGTVEELLTSVLKQLLRDDALQTDEKEQQIVEERLKALGYI